MFDFTKIDDFEKHIALSIPNYDGLCRILEAFTKHNANPESTVLDIGCSTGSFLRRIEKRPDINYVGVDIVDIAKDTKAFKFHKSDIEVYLRSNASIENQPIDVLVSMFTLQFLGLHKRRRVLSLIKEKMLKGSTILAAEKCIFPSEVESIMKREHLQQKRPHFTDTEILHKDKALFGSMFCRHYEDVSAEMKELGEATQIWQSFNFVAWAIKVK